MSRQDVENPFTNLLVCASRVEHLKVTAQKHAAGPIFLNIFFFKFLTSPVQVCIIVNYMNMIANLDDIFWFAVWPAACACSVFAVFTSPDQKTDLLALCGPS